MKQYFFYSFLLLGQFSLLFFAYAQDSTMFKWEIVYHTTSSEIIILNDSVTVVTTIYSYDNPVSATPSGTTTEKRHSNLNPEQMAAINKKLRETGFWELDEAYGVAEEERYYPSFIQIRQGGKEKEVLYRSGQGGSALPVAFSDMAAFLNEMIQLIKDWKNE